MTAGLTACPRQTGPRQVRTIQPSLCSQYLRDFSPSHLWQPCDHLHLLQIPRPSRSAFKTAFVAFSDRQARRSSQASSSSSSPSSSSSSSFVVFVVVALVLVVVVALVAGLVVHGALAQILADAQRVAVHLCR